MAKGRSTSGEGDASIANISRTRRAQLVAEIEGELGIDYEARAASEEAERRWRARKALSGGTMALLFFASACQCYGSWATRSMYPFRTLTRCGVCSGISGAVRHAGPQYQNLVTSRHGSQEHLGRFGRPLH